MQADTQLQPEVSVIIPTYKATKYIAAAVDSVLAQTFQNFEIILVNDGCPDTAALEAALQPYQSRIRYIRQENRGVSGARNTAILAARAPLILQLDADDILGKTCLESQVRTMREHPEYEAFYCNSFNFSDTPEEAAHWGKLVNQLYMDVYPSVGPVSFVSIMKCRTCPKTLGSIIRRNALLRIGLYDEAMRLAEDLDMWLRLLKSNPPGRIGYTTEPLNYYRLRGNSLTMDPRGAEYLLKAVEKAGRMFVLSDEEAAAWRWRRDLLRTEVETNRGKRAIAEHRWKDAIAHFEICQELAPSAKMRLVLAILRTCPWTLPVGMAMWNQWFKLRA